MSASPPTPELLLRRNQVALGQIAVQTFTGRRSSRANALGAGFDQSEVFMNKVSKKVAPAAKKRGADAHVPGRAHRLANEEDRKLEQGLEESMAGSDPPSITQPGSDK
jgi:hypothetical protein